MVPRLGSRFQVDVVRDWMVKANSIRKKNHTCIRTYIHTYIHTHIHTYTHSHTYTETHTHTPMRPHAKSDLGIRDS